MRRVSGALLLALIVAAVVVRVIAASGNLWLDEIWSLNAALGAPSSLDILTSIQSDNNHHLNTLWLRFVGSGASPLMYRSVSLAAGLALLGVVWLSPMLRDFTERAIAVTLAAGSYVLVLYGSEARGYALCLLAAVTAFDVAVRWMNRTTAQKSYRLVFAACVVVGLLAHATFLFAYIALLVWMLTTKRDRAAVLSFHHLPLLAVVVYVCSVLRVMQVGGGTAVSWDSVALAFATYGFGHWMLAAAFVALGVWEWRQSREYGVFFALMIAVPLLAAFETEYLHARYFVVTLPFLLIWMARAIGSLSRHSRFGYVAGAFLVVAYIGTQSLSIAELLQYGRGGYQDACRYMNANSHQGPVRVVSDHPFRARMVMSSYADSRLQHVDAEAEWLVLQTEQPLAAPALLERAGQRFRFERHFPTAPLSGMHWYVYRSLA
jgi:hypothetical protein